MSPKPKDDREEPNDGAVVDEAAADGTGENQTAAAAYGRRTITKSGKFPKTQSSASKSDAAPRIREEGKLMGSSGTSRYTLVAPRTGKKKKLDPPAE
jgi:hypothetical protein